MMMWRSRDRLRAAIVDSCSDRIIHSWLDTRIASQSARPISHGLSSIDSSIAASIGCRVAGAISFD